MIDVGDALRDIAPDVAEPGWAELRDALPAVLPEGALLRGEVALERLKSRVYRLRAGSDGAAHSIVLKRHDPWLARRNELVLRRWLPALDLARHAPRLLAVVAERHGRCVWHIYEDLSGSALDATHPDRRRVSAAVDLIAQLHMRAAARALVPECRHFCGDLGIPFLRSNVRDAIDVLEQLAPPRVRPTPAQGELRGRLLGRLYRLRDELPARIAQLEALGGPDTLLHGDLWTTNALVADVDGSLDPRLIDWDHAAVGPVSYDLSTFLFRFPPGERRWILDRYEAAVRVAAWRLPPSGDLNLLFESFELARYANRLIWPALALLEDGAAWAFDQIAEVERWFDAYLPAFPD